MAGLLDIFGGGSAADDPYADILTPAQRNQMQVQGLLAMAGAFAQAGMPSRLPIPFGSALGSAAAALGTGQEAGMKTALENALAAQKVRDLRNTAEFRKKFFGEQDALGNAIQQILGGGGTAAAPGARPAGATPPAGTGPGTAGAGGGLLSSPDLLLGSEKNPDYITQGLAPKTSGGLLDYPADQGTMRAGGGLVPEAPDAGLGTATPLSAYKPGGSLYPFKDLGIVPGGGGGTGAPSGAPPARISAVEAARMNAADPEAGGHLPVMSSDYIFGKGKPIPPGAGSVGGAPTPVPEVTSVPGGTNGIDPRKRAALDAILAGMQTAQAGPSAQRLAQFAGPGAADAPDTIPDGGGLLGVAPDLRAPIEANPLARVNAVLAQIRGRESSGNYAIPPEQNVDFPRSHASGGYQFQPGTWREWTQKSGFGQEYPQAYLAPAPVQDAVARYAALHGDVNAPSLWGASGTAKGRPYPSPYVEGGPPDELIPSGPGAGGNLPIMQAQYAPGAGGAPMPAAPAPGGVLAQPPGGGLLGQQGPTVPPGVDPAKYNALLLELARRNAAAEVLGMGNPYGSLLGVLQGTPQYKRQITGAEEAAREPYRQIARDQELKNALTKEGWQINDKGEAVPVPLYNDVAAARANAISIAQEGPKLDSALAQQNRMRVTDAQGHVMIVPIPGGAETEAMGKGLTAAAEAAARAPIEQLNKQIEQMGGAALNPAGTLLINGPNGPVEKQVNQLQRATAQAGFDVPEIGFKGMRGPLPAGQIPGVPGASLPGAPAGPSAAAGTPGPQAQGATPGGPGTLYDKPVLPPLTPQQTKLQEAIAGQDADARAKALSAVQSLRGIDDARQQLAQGIYSGTGADLKLSLAKWGTSLGWPNEKVANTENYVIERAQEVMNILGSKSFGSGAGISNNDRIFVEKMAAGNTALDLESIKRVLDVSERLHKNMIQRWNDVAPTADLKLQPPPSRAPPPDAVYVGRTKGTNLPVYKLPDGSQKVIE